MMKRSNSNGGGSTARTPVPPAGRAPWQPDGGDGTYRNPVLFADYSDPDAIRVGEDFWLTASSFGHVPGLPILHSRDLVNWQLVNHALPRLMPEDHFSRPRHGAGVWAPAIRHQAGRFWIYYPDPDFGIHVVTARDPRGPWSPPVLVRGGQGLIDPCPFWDDDGRSYLIHAWARSRSGINNLLTLHALAADGMTTTDAGVVVIDANTMSGLHTVEGPKLYKRGEYYYVFAPAGGVAEGVQVVFRARHILGPYAHRVVLEQGHTAINGPHQGAWIETPTGEHWFVHFQDRGAFGRVVHLQPMRWRDDGWPEIGRQIESCAAGEPVLRHQKPAVPAAPVSVPATSDDFSGPTLGLQWQWQANPRPEWASLEAKPGALRLHTVAPPAAPPENHWLAPNLLLQKFSGPAFSVTVGLAFASHAIGERAGLIVFGDDYAWIGLQRTSAGLAVMHVTCLAANEGGPEVIAAEIPWPSAAIFLRVDVDPAAVCRFAYSTDGREFTVVGAPFQAKPSRWVGAKFGLFAMSRRGLVSHGHADFTRFRVAELCLRSAERQDT